MTSEYREGGLVEISTSLLKHFCGKGDEGGGGDIGNYLSTLYIYAPFGAFKSNICIMGQQEEVTRFGRIGDECIFHVFFDLYRDEMSFFFYYIKIFSGELFICLLLLFSYFRQC